MVMLTVPRSHDQSPETFDCISVDMTVNVLFLVLDNLSLYKVISLYLTSRLG